MNQDFFDQVDKTLKNRERRFNFLMKKNRPEDAISIGAEFLEWIDPENVDDVFYINIDELQEMYLEKQHE